MTKEKFAWRGLGVPVTWLAELDNLPAPNALADALGDRYLYRHNPIFAAIRDQALAFGYRFSAEDTPLWRDYQTLSLVALRRILTSKTIPYFDTGAAFQRLVESNPALRLSPGFITRNLKRNYAFHESAHCVADSILRSIEAEMRAIAPHEADRAVLESILAESFANTVESLGSAFRHLPVSDAVFYWLNSYWSCNQKREDVMNRALDAMGAESRFELLFLAYFEANLATEPPAQSIYERIMRYAACTADQAAIARELAGIAFELNAGFRDSATPAYFELLGCTRQYRDLAASGWLALDRNQTFLRATVRRFWEAAGRA